MSNEVVVEQIIGNPAADAQAEVTPDPQDATPAPAPAPYDDMSARFAALSRKEKYLQEQSAAYKAEAEAFKTQKEGYKSQDELASQFKQNPLAVLKHYGISFDDMIAASLGEDLPPPTNESQIEMLRAEIEGFKTSQIEKEEGIRRAEEDAYQNSIDEAILSHQSKIIDHLSQNVAKYELIGLQGEQDLVWEVTEAHYEAHDGEILTPEQASDKVEAYLEKKVRDAMNLKRFGAEAPTTDSAQFTVEDVRTAEKPKSHTLTSDHVQQAAPSGKVRHVDIDESKRNAASLLKWN